MSRLDLLPANLYEYEVPSKRHWLKPAEFEDLLDSEAEIYVWGGNDRDNTIRARLDEEFNTMDFLKNPNYDSDVDQKFEYRTQLLVVYINGFFTDDVDLALYIRGQKAMSAFLGGTFTKASYQGACFTTPVLSMTRRQIFEGSGKCDRYEKVDRKETKGLRWKYLYNSARAAWDSIQFDVERFRELQDDGALYAEDG